VTQEKYQFIGGSSHRKVIIKKEGTACYVIVLNQKGK
jgi:hypothetical protein